MISANGRGCELISFFPRTTFFSLTRRSGNAVIFLTRPGLLSSRFQQSRWKCSHHHPAPVIWVEKGVAYANRGIAEYWTLDPDVARMMVSIRDESSVYVDHDVTGS